MTRPSARRHALPEFARFLLRHCLIGISLGLACCGGLLWLDVAGLGSLIASGGAQGRIAVGLLCFGFMVTFGSLAMGSAIFMLGDDAEDSRDDRHIPGGPGQRLCPAAVSRRRGPSRRA